jgi:PAS domain S-box-containing protein
MTSDFHKRFKGEAAAVLDAILTHDRDGIVMLSVAGDIEFVSQGALAQLLADRGEAAIGSPWRLVWPDADRGAVDMAIVHACRGKNARFESTTRGTDGDRRWWDVVISPVRNASGALTHLVGIATDVTSRKAAQHHDRLRLEEAEREAGFASDVAREMRHRLKNQLAVVGAVAKLLARHTETARDLALKLEEKLFSLARAQDLLTIHRDQPIAAREAIEQVIQASGAGERIEILSIPDVRLPDESIQALALILGELQTNALKYGALCVEGGGIKLSGRPNGECLTLRWQEECPVAVSASAESNGGFQLIRRLGSAGGQQPIIEWQDHGIIVEFHLRTAG